MFVYNTAAIHNIATHLWCHKPNVINFCVIYETKSSNNSDITSYNFQGVSLQNGIYIPQWADMYLVIELFRVYFLKQLYGNEVWH